MSLYASALDAVPAHGHPETETAWHATIDATCDATSGDRSRYTPWFAIIAGAVLDVRACIACDLAVERALSFELALGG